MHKLSERKLADADVKARILAPENRKGWPLGAVAFALFMIMLDNPVVNVALPSIQRDLGIGLSELEWTVNAYVLTFAGLLLSGGQLAGPFGRGCALLASPARSGRRPPRWPSPSGRSSAASSRSA